MESPRKSAESLEGEVLEQSSSVPASYSTGGAETRNRRREESIEKSHGDQDGVVTPVRHSQERVNELSPASTGISSPDQRLPMEQLLSPIQRRLQQAIQKPTVQSVVVLMILVAGVSAFIGAATSSLLSPGTSNLVKELDNRERHLLTECTMAAQNSVELTVEAGILLKLDRLRTELNALVFNVSALEDQMDIVTKNETLLIRLEEISAKQSPYSYNSLLIGLVSNLPATLFWNILIAVLISCCRRSSRGSMAKQK